MKNRDSNNFFVFQLLKQEKKIIFKFKEMK